MSNTTYQQPYPSPERLSPEDYVHQAFAQRISTIVSFAQQLEIAVENTARTELNSNDGSQYLNPVTTVHRQIQANKERLEDGEINLSDENYLSSQQRYTQQALGALSQVPEEAGKALSEVRDDAEFSKIVAANPELAQAMRVIDQNARTTEEAQNDIKETARP